MTAGDDDRDDDAQLQQLRAVWVTMRDEDPPDRGLASLMAAAREKASELAEAAQPSWWQRVLASLRRPPVLALATVTVLLGGALIVTQRSSMKAESTASSETAGDEQARAAVAREKAPATTAVGFGDHADGAPSAGSSSLSASSAPGSATVTPVTPEIAAPVTNVEKPRKARPSAVGAKQTVEESKPAEPKLEGGVGGAPKNDDSFNAVSPPEPDSAPKGPANTGAGLSIAQDSDAPVLADKVQAQPEPRPQTKKPIARKAPPSIEGEDRITSDAKQAPTLAQLVKQCETAAARGDCASVRSLAQRIHSSSPSVYKTKIANNASITKCLPSTADNATSQ